MARRLILALLAMHLAFAASTRAISGQEPSPTETLSEQAVPTGAPAGEAETAGGAETGGHDEAPVDFWSMLFVFVLATFVGLGVVARVSRLLHTPLMSLTNAISAIAVVGSIIVTGSDYPRDIRILGAIALFASMTNIVSGFLITDRMLKMFRQPGERRKP